VGLPLWPALDALTPGLAAVMIAIGLAHIASGDAFGSPADLPWAIQLWGARRHPTQIYETLAAALIFASTLQIRFYALQPPQPPPDSSWRPSAATAS